MVTMYSPLSTFLVFILALTDKRQIIHLAKCSVCRKRRRRNFILLLCAVYPLGLLTNSEKLKTTHVTEQLKTPEIVILCSLIFPIFICDSRAELLAVELNVKLD